MAGIDEELRSELLAMEAGDQSARQMGGRLSQAAMREAMAADAIRSTRLGEIVAAHGWPGRSLVEEDGMRAAWLVAQHTDHDPELQERFLDALEEAVARADAPPALLAYLVDRTSVNRGRPQIYGTQFGGEGDTYRPRPIADRSALDERRSAVGLEPFAEYERSMREREAQFRTAADGP